MKPSGPLLLPVLSALRFHEAEQQALSALAQSQWPALLAATDAANLTLPLAVRCPELFPAEAQIRLARSLRNNGLCHERVIAAYHEIAGLFERHNIPFLVLKGLAQWPWYVDDPRHRTQSDIDLYCPPESLEAARACLAELGYEPVHGAAQTATDHLPVMIRRTGWRWHGDYFDPERPPSVELHFRFWDPATEAFGVGDSTALWKQREVRHIGGLAVPTLSVPDGLAYSAMHLVRHLLRGDLQVRHAYEIAHFLERSSADAALWERWEQQSSPQRRLVEALAFRLAMEWFRCTPHPAVARAVECLPAPVRRWFSLFAFSPIQAASRPNKDEVWLHLCLVPDPGQRRKILLRRLFPTRRQRVIADPHLAAPGSGGVLLEIRRARFEAVFLLRRAAHHILTFGPLLRSGFRWWWAGATSL